MRCKKCNSRKVIRRRMKERDRFLTHYFPINFYQCMRCNKQFIEFEWKRFITAKRMAIWAVTLFAFTFFIGAFIDIDKEPNLKVTASQPSPQQVASVDKKEPVSSNSESKVVKSTPIRQQVASDKETTKNQNQNINKSAKPTVEATAKQRPEPVVQPSAEPIVKPRAEVVVQPSAEPVVQPSAEVAVQPSAEPVVKPSPKKVIAKVVPSIKKKAEATELEPDESTQRAKIIVPINIDKVEVAEVSPQLNKEIQDFLSGWRSSWQSGDIKGYLNNYSRIFNTGKSGVSLDEWKNKRRKSVRPGRNAKIEVSNVEIRPIADIMFVVSFHQKYSSTSYKDEVDKQLTLIKEDGHFKIYREDTL